MRALYDNKATSDNISVNSEDPNYPLTNIVDTRLSKIFRSLVNDNILITIDEEITASYCFLLEHNIPENATIQLIKSQFFIAVGSNIEIEYSYNGTSWERTSGAAGLSIYDIVYGNNMFVAVGSNGVFHYSTDGINWSYSSVGTLIYWSITYNGSLFIAGGQNGYIQKSSNGIDWSGQKPDAAFNNYYRGVFYGNGLNIIIGDNAKIMTSPDGSTWTTRSAGGGFASYFKAGCYGNNLYVIVGNNGEIQTSLDGTTWTHRTAAGGYSGAFESITYGNNLYIAVGASGEIQTSSDGIIWTSRTAAGGYSLIFYEVRYATLSGIYIIVGQNAEIQTSPDGINWTSQTAGIGFSGAFYGLCIGNQLGETATWNEDYIYFTFDEYTSEAWFLSIDFDNNSENDSYIEIGYLYLGTYLQLPGMKPDQTIKYNTTTENKISDSGQAYANRGYRFRNPKINFPSWTETQRQNMITLWEFVENHTPFIMLIWASELDVESPLYCILNQDGLDWKKRVNAGSGVMWSLTLDLLEVF